MPLYYFNVYNDDITIDEEGRELANDDAARANAVVEARTMAAETVMQGHLTGSHRIEYVDSNLKKVGEVRFDEAVEIRE